MAKKLNQIDKKDQTNSVDHPISGDVYEVNYDTDKWEKVARLEWNGDTWISKGDAPSWLHEYLLNGRTMGDKTIYITDRDFYKVFSGLTYQMFVPDDKKAKAGEKKK